MRSITLISVTAILLSTLPGCNRSGSPTVFVDPALAVLVPPDTVLLAGIRMGQLSKTKFWQDYVQTNRVSLAEDFRKRTGVDPAKDLWEFLITSNGRPEGSLALIRGKFSAMGLEPTLEREGAQRMAYKGFTMIGDEKTAVVFLNPSTAAAGATSELRRLVDNRDNITGLPPELEERIRKIPSTNQAWFVTKAEGLIPPSAGGGPVRGAGQPPAMLNNLARLAQSIRFATGGLDLRTEFHAFVDLQATDAQQADRLGGAIRALLGLGRLNTGDQKRDVLSIYDGMQVAKEDTVVHFTASIPYPVLEKAGSELPLLGLH